MHSTSSVTQQAILLQLLQQEQLQQAATAKANATAATVASANKAAATASVDTTQAPQVGAAFSAALTQLGASSTGATAHDDGHKGTVDQAIQTYSEQGPEADGLNMPAA